MTLVTVLSLSAIGAAASVQMPRTRESVLLAYAMPVAYLIASTWWLSDVRQAPSGAGGSLPVGGVTITGTTPAEVFASGNVFEAVRHLDRPGQPSGGTDTLEAAAWYGGFHLAIAAAGFAFAAFRVRSCVRTPAGARGQPTSPLKVAFYWLIDRRTVARKHPPVAQDAVWWREVWVEPGSSGGLFRRLLTLSIIAAVGYPLWVMCYTYLIVGGLRSQLGMTEIGAFQFSVRIWVGMVLRAAVQGATAVAGERDRDTWISLLATPLTGAEILRGKWAGCVWGQRNGLYLLSTVAVIGVLTGSVNPVALGVTACLFLIYLRAFAWVGLWCSLAARNTRAAIARAVALALLMGGGFWLPLGCCSAGMAMGTSGEGLGHFLLFLAGWTPLLNLGGIPLLKFEYFEKVNDGFMSGFCGLVVGSVAWWFVGTFYCQLALARLQLDTNRERPPWGRDATAWPF
jgi:ABC-type transport system involved in multi-copper enzyme maturation permease subunit